MGRSVAIPVTSSMAVATIASPSRHANQCTKLAEFIEKPVAADTESILVLLGDLELLVPHFPFDSNQEIEMHSFSFEPGFQVFA